MLLPVDSKRLRRKSSRSSRPEGSRRRSVRVFTIRGGFDPSIVASREWPLEDSTMDRRTFALGLAALPYAHGAAAQPLDGPLRLVVPYAPGGSTDRVARIVGDKLQAVLGVPVVVENRTGAGGRLAAQQLKGAPANQNALL